MIESFSFADLARRVANIVRLGKISEVKGAQVKVAIGKVTTNWFPVLSIAGDTNCWLPITVGEQVLVIAPYGEMSQAVVLRSIHYNDFTAPEDKESVSFTSKSDIKASSEGKLEALFTNGFEFSSNDLSIKISDGQIQLSSGNASIIISNDEITLASGSASVSIASNGIQLSCGSSNINSTVCTSGSSANLITIPVCGSNAPTSISVPSLKYNALTNSSTSIFGNIALSCSSLRSEMTKSIRRSILADINKSTIFKTSVSLFVDSPLEIAGEPDVLPVSQPVRMLNIPAITNVHTNTAFMRFIVKPPEIDVFTIID